MRIMLVALLNLLLVATASPGLCKDGILLAAFGSTRPEAWRAYDAIQKEFERAFPGSPVALAFTSGLVRKKLDAQGMRVDGIRSGLEKLAAQGVDAIRIQPLHILPGQEFSSLARAAMIYAKRLPPSCKAVYLGRPMLDSLKDAEKLADAVDSGDGALALVAHGNAKGIGDLSLEGFRAVLKRKNPNIFLASVEGARGCQDMAGEMRDAGVRSALIAPLMLVAGEHAYDDIAGSGPESCASLLRAKGVEVDADARGLGERRDAAAIFIEHAREAADDLLREPVKR